jgi:hypothetical protein
MFQLSQIPFHHLGEPPIELKERRVEPIAACLLKHDDALSVIHLRSENVIGLLRDERELLLIRVLRGPVVGRRRGDFDWDRTTVFIESHQAYLMQ